MAAPRTHRVVDIAAQAGLSRATVDRVLHGRAGVRAATVAQVEQAVAELDRQQSQVRLSGRSFLVDLVMQTPDRFGTAVRTALEAELPVPASRGLPSPLPPQRGERPGPRPPTCSRSRGAAPTA